MQKAYEFLMDLIISKFSGWMSGLDAIDDPKLMETELLKGDFQTISSITPYLPYCGLLTGGVGVGKMSQSIC